MTPKERYFKKVLEQASIIKCACGCGQEMKAVDNYARPRIYISGHNTPVKYEDPGQHKREWNHRNRDKRYQTKKLYHRKRKIKLVHLFNDKCALCAIEYDGTNACIFHFHHKDSTTKEFNIGNQVLNKAWKTILAEASKCLMLCANCHEKQHGEPF